MAGCGCEPCIYLGTYIDMTQLDGSSWLVASQSSLLVVNWVAWGFEDGRCFGKGVSCTGCLLTRMSRAVCEDPRIQIARKINADNAVKATKYIERRQT